MNKLTFPHAPICNCVVGLILLLLPFTLLSAQPEAVQEADAIWVENEPSHSTIKYRHFSNGTWSASEVINSPDSRLKMNYSPIVSTDKDGNLVAVWGVRVNRYVRLMYRVKVPGKGWQEEKILTDQYGENLSPRIISDLSGTLYLVWTSDVQGLDDIYMSTWRRRQWSEPINVNENNEVPDIVPNASLTADGNIEVTWQSFDRSSFSYVPRYRIFDTGVKPTTPNAIDPLSGETSEFYLTELDLTELEINNKGWLYIHFPQNVFKQSTIHCPGCIN